MKVTLYLHSKAPNLVQVYFTRPAFELINAKEVCYHVKKGLITIKIPTIDSKNIRPISKGRTSCFKYKNPSELFGDYTIEKDDEYEDFVLTKIQ